MPRGIVITKVAPAVEKVGEIETAAYEITMPAGSAIALDAYNNAEHAEVTKKTKRGCKTLELKHYLDRIEYTIEGGTLRFTALLPCGSGEALNLNPSLLTDFLRTQGAAPVWQCRVVRTHLYNKALVPPSHRRDNDTSLYRRSSDETSCMNVATKWRNS